jgi:hypothetical protein
VPFSLDTSGILDAWVRNYPRDVFPTIWEHMDVSAENGELYVIEEVVRELEKKDDGAHEWVKRHRSMIISIDAEIQTHLVEIMSKYPRLVDSKKNRSVGDPWVIALARARGMTVVTAEKATGTLVKPKIPDVCRDLGVASVGVVDFFRRQGWKW